MQRRVVQAGFLVLTLVGVFLLKGNAEQWCPFGGVEALYSYIQEGSLICSLGISSFYVLGALLISVLLLRRAFCGYLCPIGTLSEWTQKLGKFLHIPQVRVTGKTDFALSLLKYAVLVVILFYTWRMGELVFRAYDPCYALLSRNGEDITFWAYVVSGAIVAASLLISIPFCRWLCPLAVVMNPLSRFGFTRVQRDTHTCNGCGKCARVCPMEIPVDKLLVVTNARCTSCMECVDSCSVKKEGSLSWGPPKQVGGTWPRAVLVSILLLCGGVAVAATYLAPVASFNKSQGERPAQIATLTLKVNELTCRGRANLLVGFLQRDDLYRIPASGTSAYFQLEAWPGPGAVQVRVSYDPKSVSEEQLKQAITQPIYDLNENRWWMSPFVIEGYHPILPDMNKSKTDVAPIELPLE
jgi:ferredoxin